MFHALINVQVRHLKKNLRFILKMSNCVVVSCTNRSMKNQNLSFHENAISGCKIQKQPPEVFYKKSFLKIFAIFPWKCLCWSLFFDKVPRLKACNFIKNRLQQRCFPVNIAKFLRASILKNACERLLLRK